MPDGRPLIPLARPVLGQPEVAAASRAILSGWVTQGAEVAAFEREFAELVGAPRACAVSSGTAALHLALLAVGVEPGDDVITVSHSYVATANSIRYCGARPVFVDVKPGTYNMDPWKLEPVLGPRTRAVLVVHQLGMPADLEAVLELAGRRSISVVEDAACALGSEILCEGRWERLGRPRGDVACFSFHPRKLVTTGDGGMLTTRNAEYDHRFRLWRQHGMSVPDTVRHEAREVTFESYPVLGFNYRLTDIQAAVGREQLKRLPAMLERRRALAGRYRMLLASLPGVGAPEEPAWARSNWQSYCVRLPAERSQREVMQAMLDAGVATRRGVMCAHREPAYGASGWSCGVAGCEGANGCRHLEQSEQAQDHTIILPLFPQMTEAEQDEVVAVLRRALS